MVKLPFIFTEHGSVLPPDRYVGAEEVEDDGVSFEEKMAEPTTELYEQRAEAAGFDAQIWKIVEELGYGG